MGYYLIKFCDDYKVIYMSSEVAAQVEAELSKKSARYLVEKVECTGPSLVDVMNELDIDLV